MKIPEFSFLLLFSFFLLSLYPSGKPEVMIASFKNDAAGAYTLIHDDFGGQWANGIELYADTMAWNRGIPFCFALIAGQCDAGDWKKAAEMISHGHQVLNHSMHHKCGKTAGDCSPGSPHWNETDFSIEIDSSEQMIRRFTGKHPAFFMFPFDVHTDTMISYLRHKGYAGARAGQRNELAGAGPEDPFFLNFMPYLPGQTIGDLNGFADQAIENKGWAIREVHGVDDGSWGAIAPDDYRNHLNHLKKLRTEKKLWVATLSDVLMYKFHKQNYSAIASESVSDKLVRIKFRKNNPGEFYSKKIAETLRQSVSDRKLTLILKAEDRKTESITQAGKEISWNLNTEGNIVFDADPEAGIVEVKYL